MRIAALPALFTVTFLQIVLAAFLCFFALRASITHQRAAELYTEKARTAEKTVPVSTLRLQTDAVAASDHSLTACLFLSLGVAALAFVQLWLIIDVRAAASSPPVPKLTRAPVLLFSVALLSFVGCSDKSSAPKGHPLPPAALISKCEPGLPGGELT